MGCETPKPLLEGEPGTPSAHGQEKPQSPRQPRCCREGLGVAAPKCSSGGVTLR